MNELHPLHRKTVEIVFHFLVEFAETLKVFPDVCVVGKVNVVNSDGMILSVFGKERFVFFDAVFEFADVVALKVEAILERLDAGFYFVVGVFGNYLAEARFEYGQFFFVKLQFVQPKAVFVVQVGDVSKIFRVVVRHIILIFK